ncbi:hypothetical protein RHO13_12800 [Orbus wheelerorum]|uniref:hypothetical protein n=1 Tax=Orbus wheelerorum TaxID=3074111 RepID=UPI00370D1309
MTTNRILGNLKVGQISYLMYGYSNLNYQYDDKTSSFSNELTFFGVYDNLLQIGLNSIKDTSLYPNFCKVYVNDELIHIGWKMAASLDYSTVYYGRYDSTIPARLDEFFHESKAGVSYDIKIEFFDTL